MDTSERRSPHWVFNNARLTLQKTDVKVGSSCFRFCEIDYCRTVCIYLEVAWGYLPSS